MFTKGSVMKKMIRLAVLPLILTFTVGYAQAEYSCGAKKAALEKQLAYAKAHSNQYRVAGLEKALKNVELYCTNDSLKKDAEDRVEKLTDNVNEKISELARIQADLDKAIAKNDAKKVAKYQDKLSDKQEDIDDALEELKEAQTELTAIKG